MIKWIENRRRKSYKKWLRKSREKRNIDGTNKIIDIAIRYTDLELDKGYFDIAKERINSLHNK